MTHGAPLVADAIMPFPADKISDPKCEQVPPPQTGKRVDPIESLIRRDLDGGHKKAFCPVSITPVVRIHNICRVVYFLSDIFLLHSALQERTVYIWAGVHQALSCATFSTSP